MAVEPKDIRLLANPPFRRLLESRAVGQIAQNALLYTLLILVVKETDSSVQTAFLVVAWSLPSIVLGIPAGALAEVLPRRPLLVMGYLLRAAAELTAAGVDLRVVLAGDGPEPTKEVSAEELEKLSPFRDVIEGLDLEDFDKK